MHSDISHYMYMYFLQNHVHNFSHLCTMYSIWMNQSKQQRGIGHFTLAPAIVKDWFY
jgi:hypothetical protein